MANKNFSLDDMLNMSSTQQMQVGNTYTITKVERIVDFTDKKTGEIRNAVVVLCDDGISYYLPNTICNAYLRELENSSPAEVNAKFEGHTFRCDSFTAKTYGTKGKTLHILK